MYGEQGYLNLLQDVLDNGVEKKIFGHDDKYLLSTFGHTLKFDCSNGKIPIYTTKKVAYKNSWKEMLWFIEGSNDVVKLHKQGCRIWDDWGVKYHNKTNGKNLYLKEWWEKVDNGDILSQRIPVHYSNMTNWEYYTDNNIFTEANWEDETCDSYLDEPYRLDQTKWVIDNIQKTPDRKSFVVSAWNPTQVYQMADECGEESVVLPACHFYHQLLVNKSKLSLIVGLRSWDLLLGAPFNVSQYSMLLHCYAKCTGFEANQLVVQVGDAHIYSDHIEQVKEQLTRKPYDPPTLKIKDRGQKYLQDFVIDDFTLENYVCHPPIKGEITVVGGY